MKREEIICIAWEAGFEADEPANDVWITDGYWADELERFAALVAAAEREECAKVCDFAINSPYVSQIAAAIRARGAK